MAKPLGAGVPRVTKLGVCVAVLLLLLLASCLVIVSTMVDMFTDGPSPIVLDANGNPQPSFAHSLYSSGPGSESVIDIANTSFGSLHPSGMSCPWLVMFYSDGCGHCRMTAPYFAALAAQWVDDSAPTEKPRPGSLEASLAISKRLVQISAMNCREYSGTCRRHDIRGVPTFKLFMPFEDDNSPHQGNSSSSSLESVFIESENLNFSDIPVLITAHLEYYAARVPFSTIKKCQKLRRHLLASKQKRLKLLAKQQDAATARPVETTRKPAVVPNAAEAAPHVATGFREEREVHATDIANAFFQTLYEEVSLVGFSTAEQWTALTNFLILVDEALPGLGAGVPLHYLRHNAALTSDGKAQGGQQTNITEWQQVVLRAGIPYRGTPDQLVWRTCKGSAPKYRGFPCGMWLLYHSLTANYDGVLGGSSKATAGKADALSSRAADNQRPQVLLVILDYVRHYFSCKHCREHFLNFKPTPGPTTRYSAVLQLWRVHNVANFHIAKSPEGGDPLVPKRQFPDVDLCPNCISGTFAVSPKGTAEQEKGGGTSIATVFNEAVVTRFLLDRYRWDPTKLRGEVDPMDAAAAATAERDGDTFTAYRKPMDMSLLFTMLAVMVLVGAGCTRLLRYRGGGSHTSRGARAPTIDPNSSPVANKSEFRQ